MSRNSSMIAVALTLVLLTGPAFVSEPVLGACDPGERIDASTVADARKKIESAGYQKVRDLKKGCDNYWHARAEKDDKPVFVVLSPQGEVMQEGE